MQTPAKHVLWMMVAMAASAAHAQTAYAPTQVSVEAGSATPIAHWQIQDSAKAQQGGAEISSTGFAATDWYPVSGRATVMAGLLENGTYQERRVLQRQPACGGGAGCQRQFVRDALVVSRANSRCRGTWRDAHTLLRTNGMIASADVWINGHLVADHADVAGAYPVHEFDVTRWVHAGANVLAMRSASGRPKDEPVDWLGRLEPDAAGQQHGTMAGRGYRCGRGRSS